MAAIKSHMFPLTNLLQPSRYPIITSSAVATKIRLDGGRTRGYAMEVVHGSTSLGQPLHCRRSGSCSFSVSAKPFSDSLNNDDQDFLDVLSTWNCIGSSHGWLGYINPNDLSFCLCKPSLLNHPSYLPFISLPPLHFLSDNPNAISKMIYSSSPIPIYRHASDDDNDNNSSMLVVITFDWLYQLGRAAAFYRIGDPDWTTLANFPLEYRSNKIFQDIAYHSKYNLFYVITDSGEIYSWDLSSYHYCPMKKRQDCNFQHLIKPPFAKFPSAELAHDYGEKEFVNCKYYLVVHESSGALMMIRLQIYYMYEVERKLYTHDVHRLDFDRLEWLPVKGLIDSAMFIGRNNGVVVDVREFPGLMIPGYIYLACNADNAFQVTGLCISDGGGPDYHSYGILRGEMTKEGGITSFPVWNFG